MQKKIIRIDKRNVARSRNVQPIKIKSVVKINKRTALEAFNKDNDTDDDNDSNEKADKLASYKIQKVATRQECPILNLPKPVPSSNSCPKCTFDAVQSMQLAPLVQCYSCPVFKLKVLENVSVPFGTPKNVQVMLEFKAPTRVNFVKVFTNRSGVVEIPEGRHNQFGLNSHVFLKKLDARGRFFVPILASIDWGGSYVKKDELLGRCQILYINC